MEEVVRHQRTASFLLILSTFDRAIFGAFPVAQASVRLVFSLLAKASVRGNFRHTEITKCTEKTQNDILSMIQIFRAFSV
jgi:hypothetical protein